MSSTDNPRAHLDQYAAALRDLRQSSGGRPDHVVLPPGLPAEQAEAILNRITHLAGDGGFDQTAAAVAGTLAKHLPFVPVEHIGAVLLDLSQFMLAFVDSADPVSVVAIHDLPLIVALVGQEMYSAGGVR